MWELWLQLPLLGRCQVLHLHSWLKDNPWHCRQALWWYCWCNCRLQWGTWLQQLQQVAVLAPCWHFLLHEKLEGLWQIDPWLYWQHVGLILLELLERHKQCSCHCRVGQERWEMNFLNLSKQVSWCCVGKMKELEGVQYCGWDTFIVGKENSWT